MGNIAARSKRKIEENTAK